MARGKSGFGSTFIMIVLFVVTLYNSWQIQQLHAQIAGLKSKVAATKVIVRERDELSTSNASKLERARKHADLAKGYLLKGDTHQASIELEKSLLLMRVAGAEVSAPSRRTFDSMQRTVRDSLDTLGRLRKSWDKEKASEKSGGR